MSDEEKTSVIALDAVHADRERSVSPCLVVIQGGEVGRLYKLARHESVLGRSADAVVRVLDDGVSRKHAKIVRSETGVCSLVDLQSTNGTLCNGTKIDVCKLKEGDKIQIGTSTILKFTYQDAIEERFQRTQYESAIRDALTKVYNRKYVAERLPTEFAAAQKGNNPLTVVMLDVDYFKRVNDDFGHAAGDYVLSKVAQVMEDAIRGDDVLARYGGEEFIVLMLDTKVDQAIIAAHRIRERVEKTSFEFEGTSIPVTVSIGFAVENGSTFKNADELVQSADAHLYKAKQSGRNRVVCERGTVSEGHAP